MDCQNVHADIRKQWWNEEVAEAIREKKKTYENWKKNQQRCGRSTRRVDKMQRGLFP